jgi:hypothetical protein
MLLVKYCYSCHSLALKMVQMDQPRTVATLVASFNSTEWPFLSMTGAGTQDLPLQLVLVLRHADMADETSIAAARVQTTEVAHALDHALSQLSAAEMLKTIRLTDVLCTAHTVAVQTGTYYSAIAAVLVGDRLLAAGIGCTMLQVQRAERVDELLQPTTQNLTLSNEEGGLLRAALGIGFSEIEVHTCDTNLGASDGVILMVGAAYPGKLSMRNVVSRY